MSKATTRILVCSFSEAVIEERDGTLSSQDSEFWWERKAKRRAPIETDATLSLVVARTTIDALEYRDVSVDRFLCSQPEREVLETGLRFCEV